MTKFQSLFDTALTSSFIGFDDLFNAMDRNGGPVSGYPFYNIVKKDEDNYTIDLSLAGLKKEDIKISLEDNQLSISSEPKDVQADYIHKGISSRAFNRLFTLGEYMEVEGAEMTDGILSIKLVKNVPEAKKAQKHRY